MSRTPSIAQIYIFEAETGLIKIGYTTNPEQRVKRIQTSSGFKIKRQSVSPRCFNYREVEKNLHKQFAEYRRQGEWFAMDFQVAVDALNQQRFETSSAPSTQLVAFQFEQNEVHMFIDEKGDPWFVAKDVCDILSISNTSQALQGLDDDEKLMYVLDISGQKRETWCVNESGLYTLIVRSNKSRAKPFRRWVTHEVLPTIRKTGKYEVNPPLPALTRRPEYQDFDNFIAECFVADSAGLVAARDIYAAYKDWCKRHQRPVYSHKLLGQYLKEMGYVPEKRAHGRYCWLGMCLKILQSPTGAAADLRSCLSLLHRIVEKDEQIPKDEALVLIKLALEKSKDFK